ncbi:hypothetical protein [Streptacidiphilus cavernicola]|uniref:Uncharacterized protein n=1 Tax=Streptacidiphilus cavernicola TaxID=3342716 RepID=A0ABV6VYS6_9ACTN
MARYTVAGRPVNWIVDGKQEIRTAPDLHFADAMTMLRWAIAEGIINYPGGVRRTVGTAYLGSDADPWRHQRQYGGSRRYAFDLPTWDAMVAAQQRYRQILHQLREVDPGWVDVKTINYMDNSTVLVQRAADGRTREVTLVAPHGDLC